MRNLFVASAVAITAMIGSAHAQTIDAECAPGDMTIEQLSDPRCMSRIPTPAERPALVRSGNAEQGTMRDRADFSYVETQDPATGEIRTVRVVGTPFLPEDNDNVEFKREASLTANPLNAAFASLASVFAVRAANAGEADNGATEIEHLEARADLRIQVAHKLSEISVN
ncbi:MAG: hypothetical protein Rhirs2KO_27110 [Rhizobiaceae bacterium]